MGRISPDIMPGMCGQWTQKTDRGGDGLNKFDEGKSRYKITFDTWQLFLAQKIFLLNHISKGVSDFNLIKSGTKNYTCPYWRA